MNVITEKSRDIFIDYIKVIAMVLIIFTHMLWTESEKNRMLFPFWVDLAVPILMVVTGYNYFNSFKRNEEGLSKKIVRYLNRIIIPYIIIAILEIICCLRNTIELKTILPFIFTGGLGPGSYYTFVMIQVILFFPIMYLISNRYRHGEIVLFIINLIFELIIAIIDFPPSWYRLCSIRYFTFIATGIFFVKNKDVVQYNKKTIETLCLICGVGIIWILNYSKIQLPLFRQWTYSSLPTVLLTFFYFLKIFEIRYRRINKYIVLVSRASFHIYLIQMFYYQFYYNNVMKYTNNHRIILIPFNILLCGLFGVLFYILEIKIREMLKK